MTLFRQIYRVESARLPGWDYAQAGWYFVTICTKNRERILGDVVDSQIRLSNIGEIVADEWVKTRELRPNVRLDEWVVMPNHIHGIIVIENEPPGVVETHCNASLRGNYKNKFGPQRNNLSSIIRGFKSAATKRIHLSASPVFSWQPRFYDHVIRNENSLNKIRQYIANNPLKWELDKDNPENLYM